MNPSTWPPPAPAAAPLEGRVWCPRLLARHDEASREALSYIAVDEVFGAMVDLSVTPWPVADDQGRLRFDLTRQVDVGASQDALQAYIDRHRHPADLRRQVRVGDVFAARIDHSGLLRTVAAQERPAQGPPEAATGDVFEPAGWGWLTPPLYDLTDEAREYSKIAHFTTAAGTLSADVLDQIAAGEDHR